MRNQHLISIFHFLLPHFFESQLSIIPWFVIFDPFVVCCQFRYFKQFSKTTALGKKFLRVTTTQKTSLFQRLIPEFQGNFSAPYFWWRNPFRETHLFLGATIWDLGHSALNNTTFACVALPFLGFLLCLILVVITKVLFNNYCVPVKCPSNYSLHFCSKKL